MADSPPNLKVHERERPEPKPLWIGALVLLLVVGGPGYGIFNWFFCRIEPGAGEIAVLIRKTGNNLPPHGRQTTKATFGAWCKRCGCRNRNR